MIVKLINFGLQSTVNYLKKRYQEALKACERIVKMFKTTRKSQDFSNERVFIADADKTENYINRKSVLRKYYPNVSDEMNSRASFSLDKF